MTIMTATEKATREADRFATDWTTALKAELILGIDDAARVFAADFADVSLTGCSVRAEVPHGVEPQVGVVRVLDDAGESILEAAGRIVWARRTSLTSRTFGMRFRRPLSDGLLADLVQQGWISRREHARENVGLDVQIRRNATRSVIRIAKLIDRSRSGVQVFTDQPLEVGESLLLTLPGGASGMVTVVWSRASDQGYESGASFTNLNSSRAING